MEGSDATQDQRQDQPEIAEGEGETGTTGLEPLEQQPTSDATIGDPATVTPHSAPAADRQSGDPLDPATKAGLAGKPPAQGGPDAGTAE